MDEFVIIGNGKMAEALCKGLGSSYKLTVLGRNKDKLKQFKKDMDFVDTKIIDEYNNIEGKIVILCVKPHSLENVSALFSGNAKILISILAGVTIEKISNLILAQSYIRVMPNVAAKHNKSMTTITGDIRQKEFALNLFDSIGQTLWVNTQKELDIATAVAGSGPAYLALVADAMIDGGVKAGLARADASKLVCGLFDGFSDILQNNEPSDIKNSVMSPGGTTAAAIAHLEEKAVRSAFIGCIESAYAKAVQLGK